MHRLSSQTPEDFRRILKEKALMHSLFYLRLEKGHQPEQTDLKPAVNKPASPPPIRQSRARRGNSERVSALVKHYTALAGRARADSVASSDEGISDEEPRGQTLVEGRVVAVRRSSDAAEMGVVRCVRTPSVVVTDYSEVGATRAEADWLREAGARLSPALSSCSSCSTLGSRDDDEADSGLGCSRSKKIVFKDDQ